MNYTKINLMLATRKRVKNGRLIKCISSFLEKADSLKNICFTFLIDRDDFETIEFFLNAKDFITCDYQIIFNNNEVNLAKFFNQMYDETKFNSEDILVSMIGDDMVALTNGYDTKILEIANQSDGDKLIYCNDDYCQFDKLCVNLFVSRKLVSKTGAPFMSPYFPADVIDRLWYDVCKITNCLHYLPDVILRHEHSYRKEVGYDETFQRLRKHYRWNLEDQRRYKVEVDTRVENLMKIYESN